MSQQLLKRTQHSWSRGNAIFCMWHREQGNQSQHVLRFVRYIFNVRFCFSSLDKIQEGSPAYVLLALVDMKGSLSMQCCSCQVPHSRILGLKPNILTWVKPVKTISTAGCNSLHCFRHPGCDLRSRAQPDGRATLVLGAEGAVLPHRQKPQPVVTLSRL